jgi:hypothetical protein
MVDPGAAQMVIKQLNRWYRKRAKPHGLADHYYRGTRMGFTATNRAVVCGFSFLLLSIAVVLYIVPNATAQKSFEMAILLRTVWLGIVAVAILAPLQAFREFAVVTDEGLIKSNLFGRETRMAWKDIFTYQIKPDDNKVIFKDNAKAKLTLSLSYDGWQDFEEMAARRMNPVLHWQLQHMLTSLRTTGTIPSTAKKSRWAKWFSSGQSR